MTTPRDADDVRQMVADAAAAGTPLELVGRGTKRGLGRPVQAAATLDLSGLTGVTLYEPDELVMTARAGTPLAEIEPEIPSGFGKANAVPDEAKGACIGRHGVLLSAVFRGATGADPDREWNGSCRCCSGGRPAG